MNRPEIIQRKLQCDLYPNMHVQGVFWAPVFVKCMNIVCIFSINIVVWTRNSLLLINVDMYVQKYNFLLELS